jgi:hypothetical protein
MAALSSGDTLSKSDPDVSSLTTFTTKDLLSDESAAHTLVAVS